MVETIAKNSIEQINVQIKKLENFQDLNIPKYETEQSAGVDLVAAIAEDIAIKPGQVALVKTGMAIALPVGFEAQIRPRSGLALKNGITVLNTPGTIDADYRGEVGVVLINHSNSDFTISRGMRIAQMIFAKHARANFKISENLDQTARGAGGFGSTGV